jgi:ketosteroid isomerase-like protein
MSQKDIERLRQGIEAYNRRGVEAIFDLIDPDFEAETAPELSAEPDVYRGYEGIRRYFASFEEVMEEIRFQPEEFIDAGDQIVTSFRLSAIGRGTGIRVEQRAFGVWTMRNGKALALKTYAERAEALEAAGLRE